VHLLSGRRHSRLHNDSLEPIYFQVTLGRGKPETMGYADEQLYKRRSDHLKAGAAQEVAADGPGFGKKAVERSGIRRGPENRTALISLGISKLVRFVVLSKSAPNSLIPYIWYYYTLFGWRDAVSERSPG
jgi:hypothetical protein